MSFQELWDSLLPVGRDGRTGGYRRLSWTPADAACREWFTQAAAERGLRTHCDRNGNLWAWWDIPGELGGAIVTGSHLDSVPDGGAYDGPLGIASAFSAIDRLRAQGFAPARPIAVAAFCEEEGARFGVACLGSRLMTGAIGPDRAAGLRDGDGVSLAEAMTAAGLDPVGIGPDPGLLAGIHAYLELHIEQGRRLAGLGAAIGVGECIWPHGRWRLSFTGQADHAGTAVLSDRHDPMLPFAGTVLSARETAALHRAVATVGKVLAEPGGVNAVPSRVTCWLDARAPDEPTLRAMADQVITAAQQAAGLHGVSLDVRQESVTPAVQFDPSLRDRVTAALAARGIKAPPLPTAAGHDAGVLAAKVPTAMLFVRNPTGVSHSPAEHADASDCAAGADALAAVLADLASGRDEAGPGVPCGGPGR
jgi:beta-ureidopropionase / N-carbamoyl-L-amino-acid hydrolase